MRALAALLLLAAPAVAQDRPPPFAAFEAASAPVLNDPHDVEIGPDGLLYVADKFNGRIVVMDPDTLKVTGTFGGGRLPAVRDISFLPGGERAAVAVTGLGQVLILDMTQDPPAPVGAFAVPGTEGVLAHSNGRIYATSGRGCAVVVVEGDRALGAFPAPCGVHDAEEGPDGSIWLADMGAGALRRYDEDMTLIQTVGSRADGLVGPRYLDVDDAGRVVVADQDAHAVFLFDPEAGPSGALVGVIGDGTPGLGPMKFDDPEGAAVSGTRFWFADSDNDRVVRYAVVGY